MSALLAQAGGSAKREAGFCFDSRSCWRIAAGPMTPQATVPTEPRSDVEWLPRSNAARAVLLLLLTIGALLRITGVGWNITHHSAVPYSGPPTYHVDEAYFVDGLRDDFRAFNTMSIVMDGPLVSNVAYLGVLLSGHAPPAKWEPSVPILVGRMAAAVSDALALLVLWLLLRAVRVSTGVALFAVAAITFAPNHVFNAHFARTHTIANLLQLLTMLFTARTIWGATARSRALSFFFASFFAILAGSARYPFLSVGLLPAITIPIAAVRAYRSKTLKQEFGLMVPAGLAALLFGLFLGFQLRPVGILQEGLAAQAAAVSQLPWSAVGKIIESALHNLRTIYLFPGRVGIWVFLLAAFVAIPLDLRARKYAEALFSALVAGWALFYLAAWGKYGIPWQRYSIAFVMSVTILGAIGLDRVVQLAKARFAALATRGAMVGAAAVCVAILASPAYLSAIIALRFNDEANHPLYQVSRAVSELPASATGRRTVFVQTFWSWNTPLKDLFDPAKTTLRFVPDMATACGEAVEGDLLLDLAFARLEGQCPAGKTSRVAFASTNVGPPGYPYPAGFTSAPWADRHYEDFHYLFQEIELREIQLEAASGRGD